MVPPHCPPPARSIGCPAGQGRGCILSQWRHQVARCVGRELMDHELNALVRPSAVDEKGGSNGPLPPPLARRPKPLPPSSVAGCAPIWAPPTGRAQEHWLTGHASASEQLAPFPVCWVPAIASAGSVIRGVLNSPLTPLPLSRPRPWNLG